MGLVPGTGIETREAIDVANPIGPQSLTVIASSQRPGKPDLLNRIVKLFKSESPESIAALQQVLDLSDLKASIAELTLHVSTPV